MNAEDKSFTWAVYIGTAFAVLIMTLVTAVIILGLLKLLFWLA